MNIEDVLCVFCVSRFLIFIVIIMNRLIVYGYLNYYSTYVLFIYLFVVNLVGTSLKGGTVCFQLTEFPPCLFLAFGHW
jgi:hypothetical protein